MLSRLLFLFLCFISLTTHADNLFVIGASYARGVEKISLDEVCGNLSVGGKTGLLESFTPDELQPFTAKCLSPRNGLGFLNYMTNEKAINDQLGKAMEQAKQADGLSVILIPPCVPFWLVFGAMADKKPQDSHATSALAFLANLAAVSEITALTNYATNRPDLNLKEDREYVIKRVKNFIATVSAQQQECLKNGKQVLISIANISPQIPALSDNRLSLFPDLNNLLIDSSIPFENGFIESINTAIKDEIKRLKNSSLHLLDLAGAVDEDGNITFQTAVGQHTVPFSSLLVADEKPQLHLATPAYGLLAAAMLHSVATSDQWPQDLTAFGRNYHLKVFKLIHQLMSKTANNGQNPDHQRPLASKFQELELD